MWKILESGKNAAKEVMKIDERLLNELKPDDAPILHFYDFKEPSATYGHFVKPEEHLELEHARKWGLDLSKRPTGGGIIFHIWDMAFSVLIPATHEGYSQDTMENYAFINRAVLRAVEEFVENIHPLNLLPEDPHPMDEHAKAFCMAKPTKYDVMLGGRKVAGAAQRRKKQGYLHQGTISLATPNFEEIEKLLRPGTKVVEAMRLHTFSLLGKIENPKVLDDSRFEIRRHLQKSLQDI